MSRKTLRDGFTLVELTLSMLFIGVLSIAIVLIINNTITAYQRGLTLSRVNTVGSDLVDDMRSAVASSSARSLLSSCQMAVYGDGKVLSASERTKCAEDNAYNFVSVTKTTKTLKINGVSVSDEVPIYGAFCTGTYSYVWNSGYFWSESATFDEKTNKAWAWVDYTNYADGSNVSVKIGQSEAFRLIKVYDARRLICASAGVSKDGRGERTTYVGSEMDNVFRVASLSYGVIKLDEGAEIVTSGDNREVKTSTIDLLPADSGNDLAIYDLEVARPALSPSSDNIFYSVAFILGTVHNGVNIMANGSACATPNDYTSGNFNYCAINKFNFAMQVNGG